MGRAFFGIESKMGRDFMKAIDPGFAFEQGLISEPTILLKESKLALCFPEVNMTAADSGESFPHAILHSRRCLELTLQEHQPGDKIGIAELMTPEGDGGARRYRVTYKQGAVDLVTQGPLEMSVSSKPFEVLLGEIDRNLG